MNLLFIAATIHVIASWLDAFRHGQAARNAGLTSQDYPDRWPSVSVLIPAWCERGTVEECIRSLQAVDYPDWEVIIIAGGSDGTYPLVVELCRQLPNYQVVEQQPLGKNAALNQGLAHARGEIIVVLDADSRVSPLWLRALIAPFHSGAEATTGWPLPLHRTPISLTEQMDFISAWCVRGFKTLQGSGSIAIDRAVIDRIGGFPEDMLVGVDWDLNTRLELLGVTRVVCSQAVIYTDRPSTLREYWRNEVRWQRAHLATTLRHARPQSQALPVVAGFYIYALAWVCLGFSIFTIIAALFGSATVRASALRSWAVLTSWILLRHTAIAVEVATFTGDLTWIRLFPIAPALLAIKLAAIIPATVTLGRLHAHFKGPRSAGGRR